MLSIIVSWRDRDELQRALPSLLAAARSVAGEVVIVNYSGNTEKLATMLPEDGRDIQIVHVPDQKFFNKAAAQNMGAHHAQHPLLFFCDCDIVLEI